MGFEHSRRGVARVAAVLGLTGALVLQLAGVARAASVSMQDNVFVPANITVAPGETITFTNDGNNPHTATSDDGAFDTGTVNAGGSGSISIASPGTYPYFCRFHGAAGGIGMAGVITVQDSDGGGGGGGPGGTGGTGGSGSEPLPQTASPLALIAGIGAVVLLTGVWLGRRRSR